MLFSKLEDPIEKKMTLVRFETFVNELGGNIKYAGYTYLGFSDSIFSEYIENN